MILGHFHYHAGHWGMYGKALRRALAAVVLFTLGAGAPVCTENVKSGNSGDEVHRGWRVTE
jgi:hypothetical protein